MRHGDKRGRLLGYPTLNLRLHRRDIRDGVYVARVRSAGKVYAGAAFVGAAEMFGVRNRKLEVYLLHFSGEIYGQWVSVELRTYLRESRRFASVERLQKAIKNDVLAVEHYFSSQPCLLE